MTKDELNEMDYGFRNNPNSMLSIDNALKLIAEIDRLTRIMPHTGETCGRHDVSASDCYEDGSKCVGMYFCHNGKWELKE